MKKFMAWFNALTVLLCCVWMAVPMQKAYASEADGRGLAVQGAEAEPADTGDAGAGLADAGKAEAEPADTGDAGAGLADAGKAEAEQADTGDAGAGLADAGKAEAEPADTGDAGAGLTDAEKADAELTDAGKADAEPVDTEKADAEPMEDRKAAAESADAGAAPGQQAEEALSEILALHDVMALVYLDDTQTLWTEPSFDGRELAQLPTGQTVFVRGVTVDESAIEWVCVETYFQEEIFKGYMPRAFLACADEDFLQWEEQYIEESAYGLAFYDSREGWASDIEAFPESYRQALYALKAQYPNWIFVRMDTGLDWEQVIWGEMQGDRSLIYRTNPEYVRGELFDDGNWYYARDNILRYYMDPRNGLTENGIFQFELLSYNDSYHTEAALDRFLGNTFMNSSLYAPGTGRTFANIFWEVGRENNVSPFHLAARVYQEQQRGTSALISGTYPGFEGYYNYFNIRATGTTQQEVIENGLAWARAQGWYNAYESIRGGTRFISGTYIGTGQDTLYLQKYNVNPSSPYGLYEHQYMQNIAAPSSEGSKVVSMYRGAGTLNNTFVFKIPVYWNMPGSASPMPTGPSEEFTGTGWRNENGGRYWYEDYVRQGTEGRGKEIYDPASDAWYWLDAVENGKMAADKDVYQESDGGKWVRYDVNGRMIKGEDERYGGWYRFDDVTGAMIKGWYTSWDGKRYYYDTDTGQMVHGYVIINGQSLYFDNVTGVLADKVWVQIDGADYWFENGVRQGLEGRGKEIYDPGTDAWYWLDAVDNGRKAVSKDVYQESDGGKWVRYDASGHMIKGWSRNENGLYYFDPITGAMAKGNVVIDGENHTFDTNTGIKIW